MSAAQACTAVTANSVNLINKYNAGRHALGLLKQVTHTAGANADEHLNKVGAADGEERHLGLPRDRFGQQGFTSTRRAHQQNAFRNPGTQVEVVFGVLEEIDDFLELVLLLISARDIREGNLVLGWVHHVGGAFAKVHHPAAAAGLLAHN